MDVCPLADGGEGTLDAIAQSTRLTRDTVSVTGPLGEPVLSEIGWLEGPLPVLRTLGAQGPEFGEAPIAFIESARCIGLELVPAPERNPLRTTSYGLGQLINYAQRKGARIAIVTLGGSSTVDGGIGMAQALGVRIHGIRTPASGGDLGLISAIDPASTLMQHGFHVCVATDVQSPLLGIRGAVRVFAPQKGATGPMVESLEHCMTHYSSHLFQACAARAQAAMENKPQTLGEALSSPGAGAAGGIGFALQQLFNATTTSGIDLVMQLVNFEARLQRADLVITGEGRLDDTSFEGKVVSGVVARANRNNVPVHVICGSSSLNSEQWRDRGIARVQTLLDLAADLRDAKLRVQELLAAAAAASI